MRTIEENDSVLHLAPGFRLLVARNFENRVSAEHLTDAIGFQGAMATARHIPGGRGSNRILDSSGDPIRLRPYRHGGVLGEALGDRFLSPNRPLREFRIWTLLRDRGVPLPTPVFAISRRRGLLWRSAFGALDCAEAQDGAAWLETQPDMAQLHRACVAFAKMLRRFHDAGALHGDLHLRNVLVEPRHENDASMRLVLIDLDRARIVPRATPRQRLQELMRFARSLEKAGRPDLASPRFQALALSAYCAKDRALRNSMLRWAQTEMRRLKRHRLGWWFGNRLSSAILIAVSMLGLACGNAASDPVDKIDETGWSLLATGDTGRTSMLRGLFEGLFEGQLSVAQAMTQEAQRNPVDGLALLGDNFYWHGLDRDHLVPRIRTNLVGPYCYFLDLSGARSSEVEDACGIDASARAPVDLYAVLGNHDLERPESVELQREAIPDFLPRWRMSKSLAQVFEVAPGISLILFESELAIDDKAAIQSALREAVSEARGPWRILVTHRPVATDDEGFPPVGGYPGFVREALAESEKSVQLVMAGHHHSLQIFEIGPPTPSLHIGIGSGSRATPPLARNHPDARFGTIELGFARVDLVRHDDAEERLSVRLFQAPRWPWLAYLKSYELIAHFEVDRFGQVSELPLP